MKKRSLMASGLAALMVIASGVVNSLHPNQAQAQTTPVFYCDEEDDKKPVTRVRTSEGNVPVVLWTTYFFPPPYTPLVRCRQVSGRFRRFNAEGRLEFMTTGWINNQPVICVTDGVGNPCVDDPNNLLMTLRPQDDPNEILEGLLDVRDFHSAPVKHYCPQAVYTSNGRTYINVDELLERKNLSECLPTGRRIRGIIAD